MLTIENVEVLRYTNLGNNFWISQVSNDYDRHGKAYYGFTITNNIFVATIFLERESSRFMLDPAVLEYQSLYMLKLSLNNVEMKLSLDAIKDKNVFIQKLTYLCLTLTT